MTNSFDRIAINPFTNLPVEYMVPKVAEVVFVNDFFVSDVAGGAELTSAALIQASPRKVFKVHSASVTKRMLEANRDKVWVFGNFAGLSSACLALIPEMKIKYFVIEYDFKFCAWRSINRHLQMTGQSCSCATDVHGLNVKRFFEGARCIFWMSANQRDKWLEKCPLTNTNQVVLSSVFSNSTLQMLEELSLKEKDKKDKWAVLGGGSWIKGAEETQKFCSIKKIPFDVMPRLPYEQFLKELSRYKGLVFMPLDSDTCPRLVIEAKLLGLDLKLNKNVLHMEEEWFSSIEACKAYLESRPKVFWDRVMA